MWTFNGALLNEHSIPFNKYLFKWLLYGHIFIFASINMSEPSIYHVKVTNIKISIGKLLQRLDYLVLHTSAYLKYYMKFIKKGFAFVVSMIAKWISWCHIIIWPYSWSFKQLSLKGCTMVNGPNCNYTP